MVLATSSKDPLDVGEEGAESSLLSIVAVVDLVLVSPEKASVNVCCSSSRFFFAAISRFRWRQRR